MIYFLDTFSVSFTWIVIKDHHIITTLSFTWIIVFFDFGYNLGVNRKEKERSCRDMIKKDREIQGEKEFVFYLAD